MTPNGLPNPRSAPDPLSSNGEGSGTWCGKDPAASVTEKAADLRDALTRDLGGKARVSGCGPAAVAGISPEDLPLSRTSYRARA